MFSVICIFANDDSSNRTQRLIYDCMNHAHFPFVEFMNLQVASWAERWTKNQATSSMRVWACARWDNKLALRIEVRSCRTAGNHTIYIHKHTDIPLVAVRVDGAIVRSCDCAIVRSCDWVIVRVRQICLPRQPHNTYHEDAATTHTVIKW